MIDTLYHLRLGMQDPYLADEIVKSSEQVRLYHPAWDILSFGYSVLGVHGDLDHLVEVDFFLKFVWLGDCPKDSSSVPIYTSPPSSQASTPVSPVSTGASGRLSSPFFAGCATRRYAISWFDMAGCTLTAARLI